ncbi:secreted protein [Candidatus Thiomargarita nelsonii]|uniref:Secreted protein n=1 Tax=Candidatus Thiomargarita nelsonii TaxID=1003181 RepID=A0A0A6P0W8_9GAMM|nr:secreted protein [Candidatus Thiomargarita nelsonii]
MKNRGLVFLISLAVTVPLVFASTSSFAKGKGKMCVESGGGGKLTRGRMGRRLFAQFVFSLREYSKEYDEVQFFKVQKRDGFYGKLCNDDDQKRYFKRHFKVSSPYCFTVCEDLPTLVDKYHDKDGIWSFENKGRCWEVCEY